MGRKVETKMMTGHFRFLAIGILAAVLLMMAGCSRENTLVSESPLGLLGAPGSHQVAARGK